MKISPSGRRSSFWRAVVKSLAASVSRVFPSAIASLQQCHQRLDVAVFRGGGGLIAQRVEFAQQMHEALLLAAVERAIGGIEVGHEHARQRVSQHALHHGPRPMLIDQKQRQTRVAEAPHPDALAGAPTLRWSLQPVSSA